MSDWTTFALLLGGAAGALIGALFVSISIRVETIAGSVELRSRAGATLALFVAALVASILIAIPRQHDRILGLELLIVDAALGAGLLALDRRARSASSGSRIVSVLRAVSPDTITTVLLLISAVLLTAGIDAGRYVLVVAMLSALTGGVATAWLFLVRVSD